MNSFEIVPFVSVGDIQFYQTYKEIQEKIKIVPMGNLEFKLQTGKEFLLDYREIHCHIVYNELGNCISISLHKPAIAMFRNVNLLGLEHDTFLSWIQSTDNNVEIDDIGTGLVYTSGKLGMEFLFLEDRDDDDNFLGYVIDCVDFFPTPQCSKII